MNLKDLRGATAIVGVGHAGLGQALADRDQGRTGVVRRPPGPGLEGDAGGLGARDAHLHVVVEAARAPAAGRRLAVEGGDAAAEHGHAQVGVGRQGAERGGDLGVEAGTGVGGDLGEHQGRRGARRHLANFGEKGRLDQHHRRQQGDAAGEDPPEAVRPRGRAARP